MTKLPDLTPGAPTVTGPRLGDWTFTARPSIHDAVRLPNGETGRVTGFMPDGVVAVLSDGGMHYVPIAEPDLVSYADGLRSLADLAESDLASQTDPAKRERIAEALIAGVRQLSRMMEG